MDEFEDFEYDPEPLPRRILKPVAVVTPAFGLLACLYWYALARDYNSPHEGGIMVMVCIVVTGVVIGFTTDVLRAIHVRRQRWLDAVERVMFHSEVQREADRQNLATDAQSRASRASASSESARVGS